MGLSESPVLFLVIDLSALKKKIVFQLKMMFCFLKKTKICEGTHLGSLLSPCSTLFLTSTAFLLSFFSPDFFLSLFPLSSAFG